MVLPKIKVSIIVPVYEVEKYLSRCLQSLINQTLKDIEIILVNDGSPDSCPKICDDFALQDSRIKVIHKHNGGLGFARNSGLDIAAGEFVAYVDSDDYVSLNMYERLYDQAIINNSDTVFCGFNNVDIYNNISAVSEVDSLIVLKTPKDIQDFLLDMIGSEPSFSVDRKYQMSVWRAIYSKKIIDKNNLRFCSEREFISEDIIFHIDYLRKSNKISLIPDAMYYYCNNVNASSLSTTYRRDRFERYVILYREICFRLPNIESNNRAKRLLIGYTRSLIFILNDYDITFYEKIKIIKEINNNVIWNKLYANYDSKKLPLYQGIVCWLIKKKQNYLLLLLVYLKKIVR